MDVRNQSRAARQSYRLKRPGLKHRFGGAMFQAGNFPTEMGCIGLSHM